MKNLIEKIEVKTQFYKDISEKNKKQIFDILSISFGNDLDPNLQNETLIISFYYKEYLVGMVCALDNHYLAKYDKDFYSSRDSYYIDYEKRGIFIYNLCVMKSCRGNKLGYNLVKVLLNKLRGKTDYFHVQIFNENYNSIKIFEKNNFEKKKELQDGEHNKFSIYCKFISQKHELY